MGGGGKKKNQRNQFAVKKGFNPKRGRLAELGRLVRDRSIDFTVEDAITMLAAAYHFIKPIKGEMDFAMENWCEMNKMGRPPKEIIRQVIEECKNTEPIWDAAKMGRLVRLTYEERVRLKIRTIFCVDKTRAEVDEIQRVQKLERDRQKRAAKRLAEGKLPREEYERRAQARRDLMADMGMTRNQFNYWLRKHREHAAA